MLLSDGAVAGVLIVSAGVSWPGARALLGAQGICGVRPLCLDALWSLCLCSAKGFVVVTALGPGLAVGRIISVGSWCTWLCALGTFSI